MTDTQWPRFYVFKQDAEDEPHLNCGTIHASDAEMALFNARDVFVRRPECVSLWVVPAAEVLTGTREELAAAAPEAGEGGSVEGNAFAVFLKEDHRSQHSYAGEVTARSPEQALALAWAQHRGTGSLAFWVVPSSAIRRSSEAEREAWFGPARDKPYRHGSFYHTNTLMREIMAGRRPEERDDGAA